MNNSEYGEHIDFVTVVFKKYDYARLVVKSIEKYVDYPHKIHIVNNGRNEGEDNGYDILKDMFEENKNVTIIKGVNQFNMDDARNDGKYSEDYYRKKYGWDGYTKYDKREIGFGSFAQSKGMEIGIKAGNGKYICNVEHDVIFLNKWVEDILPLLDNNVFVAALYRYDMDYARTDEWSVMKRETIENNFYKEQGDLYPNCHYKDTFGLLTLWARENKKPFFITENSLNDRSLQGSHLLNVGFGEECFINGKSFLHHVGRGSIRDSSEDKEWIRESEKYLDAN